MKKLLWITLLIALSGCDKVAMHTVHNVADSMMEEKFIREYPQHHPEIKDVMAQYYACKAQAGCMTFEPKTPKEKELWNQFQTDKNTFMKSK